MDDRCDLILIRRLLKTDNFHLCYRWQTTLLHCIVRRTVVLSFPLPSAASAAAPLCPNGIARSSTQVSSRSTFNYTPHHRGFANHSSRNLQYVIKQLPHTASLPLVSVSICSRDSMCSCTDTSSSGRHRRPRKARAFQLRSAPCVGYVTDDFSHSLVHYEGRDLTSERF